MKKLMISTALVLATYATASAQTAIGADVFLSEADPNSVHASDFIGMRVYTTENEVSADDYAGIQDDWNDIGEIHDVVLSRDGSIKAVLVDIGGFLGIGERQVAVDMDAIRFVSDGSTEDNPDDFFLVMSASATDLEGAPEYTWTSRTMAEVGETVAAAGAAVKETAANVEAKSEEMAAEAETAAEKISNETERAASKVADLFDREPIMRDGYLAVEQKALTTEMLTGTRVYDENDEWIGEISELLVTDDCKLDEAVIDVGGFLGLGEKPIALSMGQIDILREDGGEDLRVYVPLTKEELEAMPTYDG